jgi:hypothetical protein
MSAVENPRFCSVAHGPPLLIDRVTADRLLTLAGPDLSLCWALMPTGATC